MTTEVVTDGMLDSAMALGEVLEVTTRQPPYAAMTQTVTATDASTRHIPEPMYQRVAVIPFPTLLRETAASLNDNDDDDYFSSDDDSNSEWYPHSDDD
jgi:hypothetical protein